MFWTWNRCVQSAPMTLAHRHACCTRKWHSAERCRPPLIALSAMAGRLPAYRVACKATYNTYLTGLMLPIKQLQWGVQHADSPSA
jgi:hypothetical protein